MTPLQKRMEEYRREAMPAIREMVLLELLAEPYIIVQGDKIVDKGLSWKNCPEAKKLYDGYQDYLQLLKDRLLPELTGGNHERVED